MLRALIRFSLRYPGLVIAAAALLVAYAAFRLPRMPIDVFPELNAPTVVVMAESGGLAADEVEQSVVFPIEASMIGIGGVRRVRSASAIGLGIVWVEFGWGEDIYRARQLVAEQLSVVRESLPESVHAEMTPMTSIAGEVMLVSVSSPSGSVSPIDLRAYAEFDLRSRLLAVPGVAQVVAIGGELPEYQVNVDQQRLALYGLSIAEVVEAARGAHSTASGGYLPDVGGLEVPVRQQARVTGERDIERTVIRAEAGAAVTIGQVADVRLGPSPRRGTASEGGHPAVILSIQKTPGTNTLALTHRLDAVFDAVDPMLPDGVVLNRDVMRQSHFIDRSIDNLRHVVRDAVIIVAAVLILFLLNVRTTIITLTALPISIAVGLLMMERMGLSLNVMTLGGLAVAIGVLVDDAIIDVENVFRRLRENRAGAEPERRPVREVVFDASNEIRPAMVFATVIIVMVFVPMLFLEGLEGRFFRPLALTYIVSILASLIVALTVTPALCALLLGGASDVTRHGGGGGGGEGFFVRWLKRIYRPALELALRRRWWVLGAAAAATAASLLLARTFGTSFLPTFNEGTYTVFLMAPPGTSLDESDRLARGVEGRLTEIEGVRSVSRRTGRAERDEHAEPVSSSEIEVTVAPGRSREAVRDEIDAILKSIPGITTMIGQPIEHRLSHVLSGTPAAIAVNIYGDDLPTLRRVAKEAEVALKALPGAREVTANREVTTTSLVIRYRHDALARAGLTPVSAATQVAQAIDGERVATVAEGARRLDIVVRLAPDQREQVDQVSQLVLVGATGQSVRLRDVAEIGPQRASNLIAREGARRKAVLSLNIAEGANLGDLVDEVREVVEPIAHAAGCSVVFGGQFEAQQSAARTIGLAGAVVGVLMLMLLQVSMGSLRAAALVMLNMPLALIGGVAAVYLSGAAGPVRNTLALFGVGGPYIAPIVSIASLVGFITLFGIAVRNGILLINHYNDLLAAGGLSRREAILQGSMERLVPILMTAVSAALGLVPLALAAGEPGSELLAPLAIVTLGGLLTSTLLNLIVVPAGYAVVFGGVPSATGRATSGRPTEGAGS